MTLELPVRWTEKDTESEKLSELLNKEEKHIFTYGKLVIDSEDIGPYYDIDDSHIIINDKLGKVYCIVIPINHFKKILTEVTGKAIMSIQIKEEPSRSRRNPPSPPQSFSDEDDILK